MKRIKLMSEEEVEEELRRGEALGLERFTYEDLLNSNAINGPDGKELPGRRDAKGGLRRFNPLNGKWEDQ